MNKKTPRKLKLARETVRALDSVELGGVRGGITFTTCNGPKTTSMLFPCEPTTKTDLC